MRFRRPSSQNPYLDRDFQFCMLRWMGFIVAVMFGIQFIRISSTRTQPNLTGTDARNIPANARQVAFENDLSNNNPQEIPVVAGERTPLPHQPLEANDDPRIDPQILGHISDNTLGIRSSEAEHFYWMLAHARSFHQQELERSARKDVLYSNLMSEPNTYRGELITFTGEMRRLSRIPAGPNEHEFTHLFEAWVFTADSNTYPIRVVATGLADERMKLGHSLSEPISITGYFFKRQGYDATGGLRVAPVILAKRIQWHRPPSVPPVDAGPLPYLLGVLGLVGLLFMGVLIHLSIDDWRAQRRILEHQRMLLAKNTVDFSKLETRSVHENLRILEWEHQGPRSKSSSAADSSRPTFTTTVLSGTSRDSNAPTSGTGNSASSNGHTPKPEAHIDRRVWADAAREQAVQQRFPYRAMSPDEYLSRFGRSLLNTNFDTQRYRDADLDRWIQQLYETYRRSSSVDRAPHQYLSTDELVQIPSWNPDSEETGR